MRWSVLVTLSMFCLAAAPARVVVSPAEDASAVLNNPDMGWVLYENYPLGVQSDRISTLVTLPKENFDGVGAVAIMFAWSDVEKTGGVYDFSRCDFAYDYWKKRGKEIQLRLSSETLLWWNNAKPPAGVGVPGYALEQLPARAKQVRTNSGVAYAVVDAREPYYLERLGKFLAAVDRHFSGERAVSLVDLRGFGLWGEWHSGFVYPSPAARREGLCAVIDCYSKALPKKWLALSYSHDPDGPAAYHEGPTDHFDPAFTSHFEDYVRYSAFDYAMTKANVTLRRDGVGGAVDSNQRKLCDQWFATLAKGPFVCEFLTTYSEAKQGDKKWMPFLINDALSLHPNYINLLGYQCADALNFVKEQPELFARGLCEMGYRLVPMKVMFPDTIRAGEAFDVEMTWVNRAVGRAMRDFHLRLRLDDAVCDAGALPTSQWIRGETYTTTSKAKFDAIAPGKHVLRFELIDPRDGRVITLPLKSNELGTIEVTK